LNISFLNMNETLMHRFRFSAIPNQSMPIWQNFLNRNVDRFCEVLSSKNTYDVNETNFLKDCLRENALGILLPM
jgi:hypothetical protein